MKNQIAALGQGGAFVPGAPAGGDSDHKRYFRGTRRGAPPPCESGRRACHDRPGCGRADVVPKDRKGDARRLAPEMTTGVLQPMALSAPDRIAQIQVPSPAAASALEPGPPDARHWLVPNNRNARSVDPEVRHLRRRLTVRSAWGRVPKFNAAVAAGSPTGFWRMARHPAVQQALRNRYFDSLGPPDS
jgi:hypothetical protein